MAKRKQNLNGLYISPRLRDSLAPIGHCALTTVVAPMGYGKTTAINWYLAEQAKGDAAVQTITNHVTLAEKTGKHVYNKVPQNATY